MLGHNSCKSQTLIFYQKKYYLSNNTSINLKVSLMTVNNIIVSKPQAFFNKKMKTPVKQHSILQISPSQDPRECHFPWTKLKKKHHIGKPRDDRSIEIIVKFVSCRHRALGYAKSKNLKTNNQNEMNDHKSFIEDSLLRQRIDLLFTNKRFYKKPFDSV